jgi:hypothetical protein
MKNGTEGEHAGITPLSFQQVTRRFNEGLAEELFLQGIPVLLSQLYGYKITAVYVALLMEEAVRCISCI